MDVLFQISVGKSKIFQLYTMIWVVYQLHEKTHLVRNCANGKQKLQLENLVRSMRFPFTVRPEAPEGIKTNYKFVWN